LSSLQDQVPQKDTKRDLERAAVLFGAKRYAESRNAYQDLQKLVTGDDREVADLRVAESDYFLKRYNATREEAQPYLDRGARRAEAKYFYLASVGGLGNWDQASILARALINEFPDNSWADEALNTLATHDILTNQDQAAADAYRESYEKFPTGAHAEHSAWKYGWWAYRTGKYAETVRVFERAAAAFPRSDYRPPYLYWSARARAKLGDQATAEARLRLVCTDYMNSYYGRLARKRLGIETAQDAERLLNADASGPSDAGSLDAAQAVGPQLAVGPPPPSNEPLIRRLLAAGMYDDAVNELHYAQKATGTSPAIEATLAWVYHEKGDLRRAITVMRRAYPQWLASGGEGLPADILQVIFPLTFWDSIRRNATARDLDPFVVAALIGQESTFDPSAHSPANAWGLMQIVPSTGRKLAAAVGIRRFSTSMLTNADTNLKLGTLYFSRLVQKFGGTYYALASYDAGDGRVVRWKADRPGLEEDEFIDDIPFPETQNYVKRILGTAEDYRHLYGEAGGQPGTAKAVAKKKTTLAKGKTVPVRSRTTTAKKRTAPTKKKAPVKKRRKKSRLP
jgi:soluble lytic murein transglycosylase